MASGIRGPDQEARSRGPAGAAAQKLDVREMQRILIGSAMLLLQALQQPVIPASAGSRRSRGC
ncbi:hypothetical protein [Paenibacillus chibensis]|uniref:hypothetical protein n=1 Tax=Paenibacillus chibensis TaxID=59846 RepID=UPI003D2B0A39